MPSSKLSGLSYSAAAILALVVMTSPARAAFHAWNLNEIYTNASGTVQYIELQTSAGTQQFVGGQQIQSHNIGNTIINTLTLPSNLPGDTTNKFFLIGTSGVQAAGGPAPDFIMPNGFLFSAGGSITFFGTNPGPYTALPTDGVLSRTWTGGNATNSPKNFAGQTSQIPAPMTVALLATGGAFTLRRRRTLG